MKFLIGLVIFLLGLPVMAQSKGSFFGQVVDVTFGDDAQSKNFGVGFNMALGYPQVTITRTSGEESFYSGISILGKAFFPFYNTSSASIDGTIVGKYIDLSNNANNSTQKEFSNQIGGGLGLHFRLFRLFLGAEYYMMAGRHYWVGDISDTLEYRYNLFEYYVGFHINLTKALRVAFSYDIGTGNIPKSKTLLSSDSQYGEQIIWLHLIYGTGQTPSQFFSKIFK
ncbi:MAG: hypothetical protein D6797_05320 [Bdellovibrio sp.]|nr:MAG: hypothetical protein D6797_05320 [Bdellovibrio sp.]